MKQGRLMDTLYINRLPLKNITFVLSRYEMYECKYLFVNISSKNV